VGGKVIAWCSWNDKATNEIKEEKTGMDESKPVKIVIGQPVSEVKVSLAREMRRNMTTAEAALWKRVSGNALGFHFRRQQIIAGFIADFYCHQAALVVEVDGDLHDAAYDAERDRIFAGLGLTTLRFTNQQVQEQIGVVLYQIRQHLRPPTP
jgi:very-short-patch-repair endonuclease